MSDDDITSKIVVAEISLIPLSGKVSMSEEVATAFSAIKKTKDLKVTLTGMGTQVESRDLKSIFTAVEAAHEAVTRAGVSRIITTIRIDQRLDKTQTLNDRVLSVKQKLDEK